MVHWSKNPEIRENVIRRVSDKLKGHVAWNKGLTKENDERMRKNTESFCRTMKERYPNGTRGYLGKSHSADTKKKMSLRRLGKTYEDIYGKNADLIRECRRQKLILRWRNESYREKMFGRTPWNKGLTKETDLRLARNAKRMLGNQCSKGCAPWNKGRKTSEETKRKMSLANKGKKHKLPKDFKPWNFGLTKETNSIVARIAESQLGNQRFKGHIPWSKGKKIPRDKYPVYWGKARLRKILTHVKPNKKEALLGNILEEVVPKEYRYVGDGSLIVGGCCPDFMNVNGKKKLVELYGDFWHKGENSQERIDYFKEFGFDTLIIWEHELKDFDNLSQKIIEFNENHSCVNFLASG